MEKVPGLARCHEQGSPWSTHCSGVSAQGRQSFEVGVVGRIDPHVLEMAQGVAQYALEGQPHFFVEEPPKFQRRQRPPQDEERLGL